MSRITLQATHRSIWTIASTILLLAGLAIVTPATRAYAQAVTDQNVVEKEATAKTAADHEALAAYYRAQAAEEGQRVARHERMLKDYSQYQGKAQQHMKAHCEAIINDARKLQKEYEGYAAAHEEAAKEAAH